MCRHGVILNELGDANKETEIESESGLCVDMVMSGLCVDMGSFLMS